MRRPLPALALATSIAMGASCTAAREPNARAVPSEGVQVEAVVREFRGFSGEDLYANGHSRGFARIDLEILRPRALAGRVLKIRHALPVPSESPLRAPGTHLLFDLNPTLLDPGIELHAGALQGVRVASTRDDPICCP
jgi:hypothetical protein